MRYQRFVYTVPTLGLGMAKRILRDAGYTGSFQEERLRLEGTYEEYMHDWGWSTLEGFVQGDTTAMRHALEETGLSREGITAFTVYSWPDIC